MKRLLSHRGEAEVLLQPNRNLGAWRWVVSSTPRQLYPRDDSVPNVQVAWWMSGSVWTIIDNLAPTGIPRTIQPVASRYTGPHLVGTRDYRPQYTFMVLNQTRGQF
jgi:hypothetical protein